MGGRKDVVGNEKWFDFERVGKVAHFSHATNSASAASFRTRFFVQVNSAL